MAVASDLGRYFLIFLDVLGGEHRPGGKVSVFHGFDEGGGGWAKASLVEEFDGVGNCSGWKNTLYVTLLVLVVVSGIAELDAPKASSWFAISG
jgi:hypothetical protein